MKMTMKFTCTAPRWAGFKSFIKDYCFLKGIEYEIDEDRGWFRSNFRVELKGNQMQIQQAQTDIMQSISEFNG